MRRQQGNPGTQEILVKAHLPENSESAPRFGVLEGSTTSRHVNCEAVALQPPM